MCQTPPVHQTPLVHHPVWTTPTGPSSDTLSVVLLTTTTRVVQPVEVPLPPFSYDLYLCLTMLDKKVPYLIWFLQTHMSRGSSLLVHAN